MPRSRKKKSRKSKTTKKRKATRSSRDSSPKVTTEGIQTTTCGEAISESSELEIDQEANLKSNTKTGIYSMPKDILWCIFDELSVVESVCLALAHPRLYAVHFERKGPMTLYDPHKFDKDCDLCHPIFIPLFDCPQPCRLFYHIQTWLTLPPGSTFCGRCRKFTCRTRMFNFCLSCYALPLTTRPLGGELAGFAADVNLMKAWKTLGE